MADQKRAVAPRAPKTVDADRAVAAASAALSVPEAAGPSRDDLWLFNEGSNLELYGCLGAHPVTLDGERGVAFGVWAPNAERVAVLGDFNGWTRPGVPLRSLGESGVWWGFVPGLEKGAVYKYLVRSRVGGYESERADPMGFLHEIPPKTASVVWDLEYEWGDASWMRERAGKHALREPMSIYECHLGSWMRVPEEGNRSLTYRELAPRLADHLEKMGFTHVEFLPVMEHPFGGSWGYQATGFFAPTSRFGTPQDFMFLVDTLHQRGIGVILDWSPSHFPSDGHGLAYFDGTHLYEHAEESQRIHPDWKSYIFNLGRNEVKSFLLSSAMLWLKKYHIDALRVDAVASMLYLDYSRKHGEWIPNEHGGRENLDSIRFLRTLNEAVYREAPGAQTIAEESTAWPMVSRPTSSGGLGFGFKWDMGWMHDTLVYMARDPIHRKHHHNEITFRMIYAFNENFVMPLSHDEVVHGKGSLLRKMPGDDWQKFANLRLLYGYMYAQPGKKLLFQGAEVAQWDEWNHDSSVDWHLLQFPLHRGVRDLLSRLNEVYRSEPALHARDCDPSGYEWIDGGDAANCVLSFLRRSGDPKDDIVVVCNFTPIPRESYRVGVPSAGFWREIVNTDAKEYAGAGWGSMGGVASSPAPWHGRPHSVSLTLPPLGVVFLKREGNG